jgi:DNA polymerase III subunit beta
MIVLKATQGRVFSVLQSVCGIVERRHTVPILANVMVKKIGNSLQFTTSDLEIQIRTTADLGGDEGAFSTTVAARKIMEILGTMTSDQIISLEENKDKLIFKGGKSRFTLQTLPIEDFPLVQETADFGPVFSIPQKTLKALLNQVSFAMAVHDIRYFLNGVLFSVDGGKLSIVATDGHRLAYADSELAQEMPHKQAVIIPRKTVLELQRLLSDSDGMIDIQFANNQAKLIFGEMEFVTKLVEGNFPDYHRVIPSNHQNVIILERLTLLSMLKRIAIMTSDKFKGVRLNIGPGLLGVAASNAEQEEATDEMDVDYDGDIIDIGFNVTYLIDVLTNITDRQVKIVLADANSSALFMLPQNDTFKYVVMPMRI